MSRHFGDLPWRVRLKLSQLRSNEQGVRDRAVWSDGRLKEKF